MYTESADAEVTAPPENAAAADSFFQDWLRSAKSGAGLAAEPGKASLLILFIYSIFTGPGQEHLPFTWRTSCMAAAML
jgi:hypothetical protein